MNREVPDERIEYPEGQCIARCDICGDDIYSGETVFDINGNAIICGYCAKNARLRDFADLLGIVVTQKFARRER